MEGEISWLTGKVIRGEMQAAHRQTGTVSGVPIAVMRSEEEENRLLDLVTFETAVSGDMGQRDLGQDLVSGGWMRQAEYSLKKSKKVAPLSWLELLA